MNKNIVIGVSVVLTLLFGVFYLKSVQPVQVTLIQPSSLGASAGTEHTQDEAFLSGLNVNRINFGAADAQAVNVATTTHTMTAAQFCDNPIFRMNAQAAATLNGPTSSGIQSRCIPKTGDSRRIIIDNSSSSAINVTFAAGDASSTLLINNDTASSTAIGINDWFALTIINTSSTAGTNLAILERYVDAD